VLVARPERHVEMEALRDARGRWDEERLAQVVQNLVSNALQHTTDGTNVQVRTRGEAHHVVLEVFNEGPPIPAEDLPMLFKPFQRGKAAQPGGRSMGLGLYIAAQIAEAHGGSIRVHSSAAHGTTFSMRLPREVSARGREEDS